MGCSKPAVSTFTGAIPEMLDIGGPEECGLCVQPKNTEQLVEALRRMIADAQQRRKWGVVARQRAEKYYALPVGCAQLLDVWQMTYNNYNNSPKK
jgi:glycosyltransferase involved in cell wall biosynthesis